MPRRDRERGLLLGEGLLELWIEPRPTEFAGPADGAAPRFALLPLPRRQPDDERPFLIRRQIVEHGDVVRAGAPSTVSGQPRLSVGGEPVAGPGSERGEVGAHRVAPVRVCSYRPSDPAALLSDARFSSRVAPTHTSYCMTSSSSNPSFAYWETTCGSATPIRQVVG